MDYKNLLQKYIKYIIDVEGTEYISIHDRRYQSDVEFTAQEWAELKNIAFQIDNNGT